ncbi:DUF7507 domain-containing protein [Flavobacterium flavipallidum]|uniref:Gliding motility-associated C-terminal domain-containing protein n=1 Tax=Flavobacterium flavipallidum TaxID=3139140 RepID=A0ABU9HI05_9FLAO
MRKNYPELSTPTLIVKFLLIYNFNKLFFCLGLILMSINSYSQCNTEVPTAFVPANFDNLTVTTNTTGACLSILGCGISNESRLIDASLTNYATASFGVVSVGTSHSLRVTDSNTTYTAGTLAGFKIAPSGGLLSLDLLNGITIKTYNDGVQQQSFSGASLLGLSLLSSPTDYIVGFNTTIAFDAIEIVFDGGVSLLSSTNIYHAVVREYCAGPALVCNTVTKLSLPTFPVTIDPANTGVSGVSVGSVADVENAINSNTNDYATINLNVGLLASGSIAIKDQLTDYPAGTYAGVEIENSNLLSLSALSNVVLSTYLNGVQREQFSGNNLIANTTLLASGGRFKLGFITTQVFDEVKLSVNQTLALNLGTTRVYGAVFENFCAGPALPCNVQTAITSPSYPVYVNNANSGINGLVCALCSITNQDNLIDADLTNYAEINLSVGVGTTGSLSVKEQITDYPAGTFAGYTIENPSLINVAAFNAVRVTTYLNGVQQESKLGNDVLVSVGTDLLVTTGKKTVGFVSTMPFDEVKITLENLVSLNLGIVKVYNAVFQKLCDPVVECNKSYLLSNPDFPVVINQDRTGIEGVACVSCAVNDTNNLLTADQNDFANITLIAGVIGSGSVAVKDQLFTYPKGTFAGYVIKDLGTLAQVNLLQSLSISTYNNGVLQESRTGGQIIDLSLIGLDVLGSVPGVYNIGFKTTLPFDEIRLTLNSVASVINSINVYGAFVDTSESDGGTLSCNSSSISVTKEDVYVDVNSDGKVNPGDRIDYTFVVKNTGFETLTNITLTDDNATVSGSSIASLAPGATDSNTFTATHIITQSDIDAGVVYNLATVSALTPFGTTITATSTDPTPCASCPVNTACTACTATLMTQIDGIALVKTAIVGGTGTKGDIITYTFSVTNTGNTTLTNIVVTDPMVGLSITGNPIASLAPGVTNSSITGVYAITQADVDAGKVTNSALVTSKDTQNNTISDISGTTVTTDDNTETPVTQNSKIALVKTAVVGGSGGLGDTITYTFAVTNTGTTTLTNIIVSDPMPGLTITGNPIASLAPGVSNLSITGTYSITQADVNAGKVTNSALVTAKDPQNNNITDISGTTVSTDDNTETPIGSRSTIALVKTAVVGGTAKLGDTITYTFTVTNTGTTTLNNVVVTDPMVGLTITGNPIVSLAPGVTNASITGTYSITQADIDAGKVVNSALVTAKDPSNNDVTDVSGTTQGTNDSTETPVSQNPAIVLVKTAVYNGNSSKAVVGDTITYTFQVTNTGNTTLNNVVISDPMIGLTIIGNPIASLGVGEKKSSITGIYTINQADIDQGKVTNSALVTARTPQGTDVQDISGTAVNNDTSTETTLPKSASLAFVKTAAYQGNATKAAVGDKITYTFTVTNTGNVTVSNIVINDAKLGATNLAIVPSSLAPLQQGVITSDYTITQADIDAGKVTNTAIAKGQDPQGTDVQDISGTAVNNDTSTETTLPKSASLAFVKTAAYQGNATKAAVGDKITYTFTVTNTGNVTVSNIVINDAKLGATNLAIVPSSLAPLQQGVITSDYTITQADIDAGKVTNTAIAKGQDPQGTDVQDISGTAVNNDTSTETTLPKSASLAFVKTAAYQGNATKAAVGDKITYTFTVTNTGNVTVSNIVINDAKLGATNLAIVPSSLAPLQQGVITSDYTITQADIDAGKVTNTAIAKGQDPQGTDVQDISGTAVNNDTSTETTLPKSASLAFVKTAAYQGNATKAAVGDNITYTFTVTNTGNVTVSNIVINDAKLGATNLAIVPSSLAPLQQGVITSDYTITQADIDAGKVTNTAIAKGQDPQGTDVQDISGTAVNNDTSTETTLPKSASLAFVKTAAYQGNAAKAAVGDKITYTFTVTNTGNVTVSNIVINDAKLGATNLAIVPSSLAPLQQGVITSDYTITQADIDAGKVTNTAIAKGQDPQGTDVQDISGTAVNNDTSTETTLPKSASLAFVKTAAYQGNATKAAVGDKITYTFTVTNTGNVTVSNIVINDAILGATNLAIVPSSLAPLQQGVITSDYTITQADIDAGKVTNTAIAKGQDPQGTDVQDISGTAVNNDTSTETTLPQDFKIALVKTGVLSGVVEAGGVINYTFAVTNIGNGTINNIVISDPMVGLTIPVSTIVSLAPGATNNSIIGTYILKQSDIDAGVVVNSALAVGKDSQGNNVQDISGTTITNDNPTTTTLSTNPSISITKDGVYVDFNNDGIVSVGDRIDYSFVVINTGNTSLSNVMVTDAKAVITGTAIPDLAYNTSNSTAFTGVYIITQTDINAGVVYNLATVEGTSPKGVKVTNTSTDPTPCVSCPVNPVCPTCTMTLLTQSPKIALLLVGTFQDENQDGQAQIGETIKYTYTIMNTGNVPLSNVWIEDEMVGHGMNQGIISLAVGATDNSTFTSSYTITQQDIIAGRVTNQAKVFGTSPLDVIVEDLSDTDNPLENDATVVGVSGCEIKVFNAVSPNLGSDFERILYIRGIECYPKNTVQIFDRWGVKVFEVDGYDNANKAFRGMSDGRTTISQSNGLPSGTYFYVIKYTDAEANEFNKSGYLHLIND